MYFFLCVAVLVLFLFIERFCNTCGRLLWSVLHGTKMSINDLVALQSFTAVMQWVWNVVLSVLTLFATVLGALAQQGSIILITLVVGIFMTYLYEFDGESALQVIEVWNAGTGQVVRNIVYGSVEIASQLALAVLPLYNASVWLASQLLRMILFSVEVDHERFVLAVLNLAYFMRDIVLSFVAFTDSLGACQQTAENITLQSCFDTGLREFDAVTPLTTLGTCVFHLSGFLQSNCVSIGGLVRAAVYPLTDPNFPMAVHGAVNTVALGTLHAALLTWERGRALGQLHEDVRSLGKMPDLNPAFDSAVSGLRNLGYVMDNWMDVIALEIEQVVTGSAPVCPVPATESDVPGYNTALFGTNETRLVALTDGLYAVTDGVSVEYVSYYHETQRVEVPLAWPIEVDVRLGIAAVKFGDSDSTDGRGRASTAMLGCRCDDFVDSDSPTGQRMDISCAILPMHSDPVVTFGDYFVPAGFNIDTTSYYAQCSMMTISVQSVRWPLTRVAAPETSTTPLRGTRLFEDSADPVVADAVLWVTPRCALVGASPICTEAFVDAGCFPYCLAVRPTASGNRALRMYNARDWDERVHLVARDCLQDRGVDVPGGERFVRTATTLEDVELLFPEGYLGGTTTASADDVGDVTDCRYDREVESVVPKRLLSTAQDVRSVRLDKQPYVFAGDAVLFVDEDAQELFVKRLYGAENWQYTMREEEVRVPVNAPCYSEGECAKSTAWDATKVTVEKFFSRSPGTATAAVATRWSVFYVVNPDADIYRAFFGWCRLLSEGVLTEQEEEQLGSPTTGFAPTNAYNAPRLWRIDTFANNLGLVDGALDVPPYIDFRGYAGDMLPVECAQPVNMSIASIAYVNERNVAVTVLEASPLEFNPITNRLYTHVKDPSRVRYVIYYVDPLTMRMRTGQLWELRDPTAASERETFCPAQRRMPTLGTFMAQTTIAGIESLRMPINVVLALPTLFDLSSLRAVRRCPTVTLGHTMLRECGASMFSLDRHFEALIHANEQFWRVLSDVSTALGSVGGADLFRSGLNGMRIVLQERVSVSSILIKRQARQQYLSLSEKITSFATSLQNGRAGQTAGFISGKVSAAGERIAIAGRPVGDWVGAKAAAMGTRVLDALPSTVRNLGSTATSVLNTLSSGARKVSAAYSSTRDGYLGMLMRGVKGSVAFSWWSYRQVVRIGLDLVVDGSPYGFVNKVWTLLYGARVEFRTMVTASLERTCGGMGLLFGGSGALSELSHASCLVVAYLPETALDVLTLLFVDYPMLNCVCSPPGGLDFTEHALGTCLPVAPKEYRSVLLTIIDAGLESGQPRNMCIEMARHTNERLYHALDLVLSSAYDASRAVEHVVDQLLGWIFIERSTCDSFYTSPYVITLMPTPIDYWQVCGNTSVCRQHCGSLIAAFEDARRDSTSFGHKVLEYDMVIEDPLINEADIENRARVAPFDPLAIVEHVSCDDVCGHGGRCFSTAGIGDDQAMTVVTYCVPFTRGVSIYEAWRWSVFDSAEWTPEVVDVYFLSTQARKPSAAVRAPLLCVVQRAGIYLYNELGAQRQIVRFMGDELYASAQASAMHSLSALYVVPAVLQSTIVTFGRTLLQRADGSVFTDNVCSRIVLDPLAFTSDTAVEYGECQDAPDEHFALNELATPTTRVPVFSGDGATRVIFVPLIENSNIVSCKFDVTFTMHAYDCDFSGQLPHSLVATTLAGATSLFQDSRSPVRRRSRAISMNSLTSTAREGIVEHNVFTASSSLAMWISELRIAIGDTGPLRMDQKNSIAQTLQAQVARSCAMDTCGGCVGLTTQKLCYAAQQCALARCVGTPVNFRKATCALGGVFRDLVEMGLALAVSFWLFVYELTSTIVNSATGVAQDEVRVSFPLEAVNSLACETKDLVVHSFAVLMTLVFGLKPAQDGIADRVRFSPEAANEFFAQTTLIIATVTNMFSHMMYLMIYMPMAAVNVVTCGVNQVLMAFDPLGKRIRIGRAEEMEALGVISGTCTPVSVAERIEEVTSSPEALRDFNGRVADTISNFVPETIPSGGEVKYTSTGVVSGGVIHTARVAAAQGVEAVAGGLNAAPSQNGHLTRAEALQARARGEASPLHSSQQTFQAGETTEDIGKVLVAFFSSPVEVVAMIFDSMITWLIGIVRTIQDIIQVSDRRHCKLPDVTMEDVPRCPCGDTAASIVTERRSQGVNNGALWCAGTMDIVLSDGTSRVIYNPYSLTELLAFATTLEQYLACVGSGNADDIAGGCDAVEPKAPELERQGVKTLAVLTRCRSNYVNRQWDSGAVYLFQPSLSEDLVNEVARIERDFNPASMPATVVECMAVSIEQATLADGCLDLFLNDLGLTSEEYFTYDEKTAPALSEIDACEVFTGPAALLPNSVFADCVAEDGDDEDCELPYFLWTGRSANRVPVATSHFKSFESAEARYAEAEATIERARQLVAQAYALVEDWDGSKIEPVLFSAEGDGLHQAMDCMIMGPYGAADLWPVSAAVRYSRDATANGPENGLSREFELQCERAWSGTPFTCGTAVRQRVMYSFVHDHLGGVNGSGLRDIVVAETQAELERINEGWSNENNFGCRTIARTSDGSFVTTTARDVLFCSADHPLEWTSYTDSIGSEISVDGSSVLAALTEAMQVFVERTLVLETPGVIGNASDVWTEADALLAVSLGAFDPLRVTVRYDSSEAMEPLAGSLWEICTAHAGSVMASMPLRNGSAGWTLQGLDERLDFDPFADAGTFVSSLEAHVAEVMTESFARSPLHWTYGLRHVASDSLACEGASVDELLGDIGFDESDVPVPDVLAAAATGAGLDGQAAPVLVHFGMFSAPLGSIGTQCVCGWVRDMGAPVPECVLPRLVCSYVEDVGTFDSGLTELCAAVDDQVSPEAVYSASNRTLLREVYWATYGYYRAGPGDGLPCDALGPSDRWGVHGDAAVANWTQGLHFSASVRDVLTSGRAGVRLGSLHELDETWPEMVHPGVRSSHAWHPSESNTTAAQKHCATTVARDLTETSFVETRVAQMVRELFPVAQAVHTSSTHAYCTRFALEVARESAMALLGVDSLEMDTQAEVVQTWRGRCQQQVSTVGLCMTHGVYDIVPDDPQAYDCPFTIIDPAGDWYVSPGCLVYDGARFYDPCACLPCDQNEFTLDDARQCTALADIRALVRLPEGVHLHLPDSWAHLSGDESVQLAVALGKIREAQATEDLPLNVNGAALFEMLHAGTDASAVFNADSDWRRDEGLLSARHCDAVFDWWPDEWSQPVGYHVTAPPFADEAGYRVYDHAFVVDRSSDLGVFVRYEHTYVRNQSVSQNRFGASGVCNAHTYGLDMRETNLMRTCTETSRHTHADPTVPVRSSFGRDGNTADVFHAESCSDNGVPPWEVGDNPYVHAGAGLVNLWVDNTHWPPLNPDDTLKYKVPKVARFTGSFDSTCPFPGLFVCQDDSDCLALALDTTQDLFCASRGADGVCAVRQQRGQTFECIRHSDCAGEQMCAGTGHCVTPVIEYDNRLSVGIEAHVFAQSCESRFLAQQDMWGASPFEEVPDLLRAAGMCSYRESFEHRDLLSELNLEGVCTDEVCTAESKGTSIRYTASGRDDDGDTLWAEDMLKVAANPCDRDYMHLAESHACYPSAAVASTFEGTVRTHVPDLAPVFRTHRVDGSLPLFRDTARLDDPFGFSGITGDIDEQLLEGQSMFRFCSDIEQCYLQQFTVNGYRVPARLHYDAASVSQTVNRLGGGSSGFAGTVSEATLRDVTVVEASFGDIFLCGAFGMLHPTGVEDCILDPLVVPLYYALCHGNTLDAIAETCLFSFTPVQGSDYRSVLCEISLGGGDTRTLPTYNIEEKGAVEAHMNYILAGAFVQRPDNILEYASINSCAALLWTGIEEGLFAGDISYSTSERASILPRGLYFFTDLYGLSEFPFAWWVKCTLIAGHAPARDRVVACPGWDDRTSSVEMTGTVREALERFDGGITRDVIDRVRTDTPGETARSTCLALDVNNIATARQYLASLFHNISLDLQASEEFSGASRRMCYTQKDFATEYEEDFTWMRTLYRSIHERTNEAMPDEYVTRLSPQTVGRPANVIANEVWAHLCEAWFGNDVREWFVASDDIMDRRYLPQAGVPVVEFLLARTHMPFDSFPELYEAMEEAYNTDVCEINRRLPSEFTSAEEVFCIFENQPGSDPLIALNAPDYPLPVSEHTSRPYVYFDTRERSPIEEGSVVQEIENLLRGAFGARDAYLVNEELAYGYNDVCAGSDIDTDQYTSCALSHRTADDLCSSEWAGLFDNPSDFVCTDTSKPSPVADSVPQSVRDVISNDWEADAQMMCWNTQGRCLGSNLHAAKYIYAPPGVELAFYSGPHFTDIRSSFAVQADSEPIGTHIEIKFPVWMQCPGSELEQYAGGVDKSVQRLTSSFSLDTAPGMLRTGYHTQFAAMDAQTVGAGEATVYKMRPSTLRPYGMRVSVQTDEGYQCCSDRSPCRCAPGELRFDVRLNMVRCVACSAAARTYCFGEYDCVFSAFHVVPGSADELYLLAIGLQAGVEMTPSRFAFLAHQLMARRVRDFPGGNFMHVFPETQAYYTVDNLDAFTEFDSKPGATYINSLATGDRTLEACATADTTGLAVDYTRCHNDEHLREFASFVDEEYRANGFVKVPAQTRLAWRTSRAQLTSQTVYAYSVSERALRDRFSAWLLDIDLHCLEADMYTSICKIDPVTERPDLFSPWTGGIWNALELCDTSQDTDYGGTRIDISCNRAACPNFHLGNYDEDPFFDGVREQCIINRDTVPQSRLPPRNSPTNLCAMSPENSFTCAYRQGALGGRLSAAGLGVDGEDLGGRVGALYTRIARPTEYGGLFGRARNLLFEGRTLQTAGYGSSAVPVAVGLEDIGGHHLRFEISEETLLLNEVVLGAVSSTVSSTNYLAFASALASEAGWLVNINARLAEETVLSNAPATVDASGALRWQCPYERLVHWGDGATLPESRRAGVLFGAQTLGRNVHPVQATGGAQWRQTEYSTSNGHCLCIDPSDCVFDQTLDGACTLKDAIRATYDRVARPAQELSPQCVEQHDWPFTGGTLRDGFEIGSAVGDSCSLFDRLPAFNMRQRSGPPSNANFGVDTTGLGGDCHTGRATRFDARESVRGSVCILRERNETHTALLCDEGVVWVPRERSASPPWLVERMRERRRLCAEASPLPAFRYLNHTLPNVSSFGQPTRVSPPRMLAADLLALACRHADCVDGLDPSEWTVETFWDAFLRHPEQLLASPAGTASSAEQVLRNESAFDDSLLWGTPWVACEQRSGSITECAGNISRAEWFNASARGKTCANAIREHGDALVLDMQICDLDAELAGFCRQLAAAQSMVNDAHCRAAGQCFDRFYFYYPGTYSVSNDEFIWDTVREYYLSVDPQSCPATEAQQTILEQNDELRIHCGALVLEPLVGTLQIVRQVLRTLLRLLYYVFMILVKLMTMIAGAIGQAADFNSRVFSEILFYLSLIIDEFSSLFNVFSDIVFEILFNGPWGDKLRELIYTVCSFLSDIWEVISVVICPVSDAILTALSAMGDLIDTIADFKLPVINRPFSFLKDINPFRQIASFIAKMSLCNKEDPLQCDRFLSVLDDPVGTLPVVTRCWTQFIATLGDQSSLSCTSVDTCLAEDGSLVVCDQCPIAPESVNDFACDPITKTCKCGVPIVSRTPCLQHRDCVIDPDAQCDFLDIDLVPTFSSIPCGACPTRAMCVVSDGDSGVCSCPIQAVGFEACAPQNAGERVTVDPGGLCMTSLGVSDVQLQSYGAQYDLLAGIPCRFVEPARSFCYEIWLSPTLTAYYIVALDFFSSAVASGPFRRLLGAYPPPFPPLSNSTWRDATGLCSALVLETGLTGRDAYALQQCVKWRGVARDLITQFNLTHVDDHFLLSIEDFALLETRALLELLRKPQVLVAAASRSAWFLPVRRVAEAAERWVAAYRHQHNSSDLMVILELASAFLRGDVGYFASESDALVMARPEPNVTVLNAALNATRWHHVLPFADSPVSVPVLPRRTLSDFPGLSDLANFSLPELHTVRRLLEFENLTVSSDVLFNAELMSAQECSAGFDLRRIVVALLSFLRKEFLGQRPPEATPARFLRDAVPMVDGSRYNASLVYTRPAPSNTDPVLTGMYWAKERLDGWTDVRGMFYSMLKSGGDNLASFLTCDLEKVHYCTEYNRKLVHATILATVAYVFGVRIARLFGLPFVSMLFLLAIPVIAMFYSLGYSPFCFPMVPPCILREFVSVVDTLLPSNITLPVALELYPGCIDGEPLPAGVHMPVNVSAYPEDVRERNRRVACLLSCFDAPHSYTRAEVSFAWWLCDTSLGLCSDLRARIIEYGVPGLENMQRFLLEKAEIVVAGDPDLINAQRFCATLTLWMIVPWLVLFGIALYMISWSLIVPVVFVQGFISILLQFITGLHVSSEERMNLRNIFLRLDLRRSLRDGGRFVRENSRFRRG